MNQQKTIAAVRRVANELRDRGPSPIAIGRGTEARIAALLNPPRPLVTWYNAEIVRMGGRRCPSETGELVHDIIRHVMAAWKAIETRELSGIPTVAEELLRLCDRLDCDEKPAGSKPGGRQPLYHPIFLLNDKLKQSSNEALNRRDIAREYINSLSPKELATKQKEHGSGRDLEQHYIDKLRNHKDKLRYP